VARYTDPQLVRAALRAPTTGDTSWTDGSYDSILELVSSEADTCVDDLCPGWAPFDTPQVAETRQYVAGGEAVYGILTTDPYTSPPTSVKLVSSYYGDDPDYWPVLATNLEFVPLFLPTGNRSGKSIELVYGSTERFREGLKYLVSGAEWGWRSIPAEVRLAATRIAARSFASLRNNQGVIEFEGGVMYEPRFDTYVMRLLKPYTGGEVV